MFWKEHICLEHFMIKAGDISHLSESKKFKGEVNL
jgi:hypothetical protein